VAISWIGGGTGQICLHFSSRREEKLWSCRHLAGGKHMSTGHMHLDLQICRSCFSKKKSTPFGVLFFLLLVYTLDITFQPLKTIRRASKIQIFRPQVST